MQRMTTGTQTPLLASLFAAVFLLKVVGYALGDRTDWHHTTGDAQQYHAFAVGLDDKAYSLWSWILRFLHDMGLYSRDGVTTVLFLLAALAVPLLCASLVLRGGAGPAGGAGSRRDWRAYWLVALVVAMYPPLLYFSLDIYRDVFMIVVFCLGLLAVRAMIEAPGMAWRFALLVTALGMFYVLYLLRPYLGFACVVGLAGMIVFRLRSARLWAWMLAYLLGLWLLFALGFLDAIAIEYRQGFDRLQAGSNFGIQFHSAALFIPQFLQSGWYQLGGFSFPRPLAWLAFLLESVPFMLMAGYIVANRRYTDRFVDFLLIFFIAYATIWVLGNDNLGTAIRLRMFNYLVVMMAWGSVLHRKWSIPRSAGNPTE